MIYFTLISRDFHFHINKNTYTDSLYSRVNIVTVTHAEGHIWNLVFPSSFSYKHSFWDSFLHLQILSISQGLTQVSVVW